jgi:hypothetical protein
MQVALRKYFWTIHLVFFFLAALIAVSDVNLFLESESVPLPTDDVATIAVQQFTAEPAAHLGAETLSRPPIPTARELKRTEPAADPNAALVKGASGAKLLGTLISTIREFSIASILDMASQRAQTCELPHFQSRTSCGGFCGRLMARGASQDSSSRPRS